MLWILLVISALSLAQPQVCGAQKMRGPGDESGTLVMAARTDSSVIIVADSKITLGDADLNAPSIDGNRKLVDVGKYSACGIVGWLGNVSENTDVSEALRAWVRKYPKVEAYEGLQELLNVAADQWNHKLAMSGMSGDEFLKTNHNRQIGNEISELICASLQQGQPTMVRGRSLVKSDFTAAAEVEGPVIGNALYARGVLRTPFFVEHVLRMSPFPVAPLPDPYPLVENDIRSSPTDMSILQRWYGWLTTNPEPTPTSPSPFTQSAVKQLFGDVFSSVETHFPDQVAPPNNVRIVGVCGRASSTLGEKQWPTCRRSSWRTSKRHQTRGC
jgi:hypothetical protein